MSNRKTFVSRRKFLAGLGVGGAALPLLPMSRARSATAGTPAKRLVVLASEQGTAVEAFWPTGAGTDLTQLKFGPISEPVAPYAKDLLFLGGVEQRSFLDNDTFGGGGHAAWGSLLTGSKYALVDGVSASINDIQPGSISVEQFIANAIQARTPLPFKVLNLCATTQKAERMFQRTLSASGPSQLVEVEKEPQKLFDRLFGGSNLTPDAMANLRALNKSILDQVATELVGYTNRFGGDAKVQLQAHLDSVREIERQLSTINGAKCEKPPRPTLDIIQTDHTTKEQEIRGQTILPALIKAHLDLIVMAVMCDLTRVATLEIGTQGTGVGLVLSSWPGIPADIGPNGMADHHTTLTHGGFNEDGTGTPQKVAIERFVVAQFAYLVGEFKKRQDPLSPGKTLLDNSIITYTNSNGSMHSARGLPWMIAGSAGGYFKTGRLVKFGDWATKGDKYWTGGTQIPHNAILAAICNAMDVPVSTFGDAKYGGEQPGLRG